MKRLQVLVLSLLFMSALAGCNQKTDPGGSAAVYIGESVTTVDITHYIGGKSAQWVAEGQEVDALRNWVSKLEYEILEFEEGQSPGDSNGGEVYIFVLTEGSCPGFSYVINGSDDCYLLVERDWFSVRNPSNPPVMEPQREK